MIDYFDCSCKPDATIFCPNCVQYLRSKRSKGVNKEMEIKQDYEVRYAKYRIVTPVGNYWGFVFDVELDGFIAVADTPIDREWDADGKLIHKFYGKPQLTGFSGSYVVEHLAQRKPILCFVATAMEGDYEPTHEDLEEELEF